MTELDDIELRETLDHDRIVDIVCASLESENISYETEKTVAEGARVDVFFDGIVLEIKSDLCQGISEAQLEKYERAPSVDMVALVLPEDWATIEKERRDRPVIAVERGTVSLEL